MTYKIVEGKDSYYEISLSISQQERDELKNKALTSFQKDVSIPGFRKGHVPLHMVESKVKSSYVLMAMLEQVIHTTMQKVLQENKDKQFVGQPYDVNPLQLQTSNDDGAYEIRFKVDVYPEAKEQDKKWEKAKMEAIDISITQEKKDSVLQTIQKQFASYSPAETIAEDTVAKIRLTYLKNEEELSSKTIFVGDNEYKQEPLTDAVFTDLRIDQTKDLEYAEDTLPAYVHYGQEEKPDTLRVHVQDIKKTELPELTDEFIAKNLGQDGQIQSVDDLQRTIENTLQQNQLKESLENTINNYISTIEKSFAIAMPSTFVQEELKHRVKSMTDQLGGEDGFKAFFDRMGEEKARAYMDEMKEQAKTSLRRFFLMKHLIDSFGLDVDWNTSLDAEKKLYVHLTGESLPGMTEDVNKDTKDQSHTDSTSASTDTQKVEESKEDNSTSKDSKKKTITKKKASTTKKKKTTKSSNTNVKKTKKAKNNSSKKSTKKSDTENT